MQHSLFVMVTLEMSEAIRWVRFGKRTQKWGVKAGLGSAFDTVLERFWGEKARSCRVVANLALRERNGAM
jgi:hypothetical protein